MLIDVGGIIYFLNYISFKSWYASTNCIDKYAASVEFGLHMLYLLKSNFSSPRYEEEKFRKKLKRYIHILIRVASR